MTHVVTEACIKCKYTDCVDVCPVGYFREGPNFLVIDPDECIGVPFASLSAPSTPSSLKKTCRNSQQRYIKINADLARLVPSITKRKGPQG